MAERHELEFGEREILEHSLKGGSNRVFRNYFAVDLSTGDGYVCLNLVRKGFMVRHVESAKQPGLVYFHVTQAGAEAVGLQLPK